METPSASPRPRSHRRRLAVLLLALLAGPLVAEGVVRWLLFGESALAARWGANVRQPELFGNPTFDDAYWRLRHRLGTYPADTDEPRFPHPTLGWRTGLIHPKTLVNKQYDPADPRRPVLFYGASYAMTEYRRLFVESELDADYTLVPYGVGGYGVDQVYMLIRGSLDLYEGRDPIVVIGLKTDGDFRRCGLEIRLFAKPRFALDERGELVEPAGEIAGTVAYHAAHPIGIRSYLWSWLVRSQAAADVGWRATLGGLPERMRAVDELSAALVRAIEAELSARGLQHGYLLFSGPETTKGAMPGLNHERTIVEILEREGAPYVLARPALVAAAEQHGEDVDDYFVPTGEFRGGHPSPLGRRRTFPSLRRAVLGDYDGP